MTKLSLSIGRLQRAIAVGGVLMLICCAKDPTAAIDPCSSTLRFEVAETGAWNTLRQDGISTKGSCSITADSGAGVANDETLAMNVFALQGGDSSKPLFLHAAVSEHIHGASIGPRSSETRAAPVETASFYNSFGVLTSVYTGSWSESTGSPNYMYNTEVTEASAWTTSYHWPGSGHNVRFFAYAPYNGTGIALSDKTTSGTPTITYTVPAAVADQKDLLVTASAEYTSAPSGGTASLAFAHALTAVRFATGDDMLAGTVTKITLKGVYGSATLAMGSTTWNNYGTIGNFTQALSKTVNGSANEEITPSTATFMMLPQTLPSGASIEIIYTDRLTGTQRTLSASIDGSSWPIGQTVTYRISTSSILVTPTFTVTAPADFAYAGGDQNYSVTSNAIVARAGDDTKTLAVPWSAEFVEDYGSGGYNVIARPAWLTNFTTSGSGGSSAADFTATVAAQTGVTSNTHNAALQMATPVGGTYDLSTKGGTASMSTANCYLINAPGTYSLPLVYGNAIKNGATNSSAYTSTATGTYVLQKFVNHLGNAITDPYIYNNTNCTPANATLVWQDAENLVTNVALSADHHSLTFTVGSSTIKQGNALVAVRNASNEIMWSWHIWVTDYVLGTDIKIVTNSKRVQYRMMPVNVGWCDDESTAYAARSVKVRFTQLDTRQTEVITVNQPAAKTIICGNNTYFQFGRKDPMLPGIVNASNFVVDKSCYAGSNAFVKSGAGKVTIATSILNPFVFYNYGSGNNVTDWCSTSYNNLWSANTALTTDIDAAVVKTVYDPSPVGYELPAPNAFTGFTSSGSNLSGNTMSNYNSPYTSVTEFTANLGWMFYCNKMNEDGSYDPTGGTIFFPAAGYRDGSWSGPYVVSYNFSYWWLALPDSIQYGYNMTLYLDGVLPLTGNFRYYGYAVRSVQE